MARSLEAEILPTWPSLAWVAEQPHRGDEVRLRSGTGVEHGDGWWCEAVWDGAFDEGDFDRTDVVFGSGGRRRADATTYVSAGAVSDRLHRWSGEDAHVVSNSLPALLAHVDGSLLEDHDHLSGLLTVRDGVDRYERTLATTRGPVELVYHDNLVVDAGGVRRAPKPRPTMASPTYDVYVGLLRTAMRALADNAASPSRANPLSLLSTCSAGYDSSAVTALASGAGCHDVLSILESRDREPDSGECVARALGMEFHGFRRDGWTRRDEVETRLLAAGVAGGSSIPLVGAEALLGGRVLLTAYHGDQMWRLHGDEPTRLHARADLGGADLMEFRLSAGFQHVMFPFVGSAVMPEVREISRSEQMAPWRTGGSYDRPIPRRILEEANVPEGCLAGRKRAMQSYRTVSHPTARAFAAWWAERGGASSGDEHRRANGRFRWAVERERQRYLTGS